MNYNNKNNDFNFEFSQGDQPTHMSYKKYKKKVEPKPKNENLALFVGAFFMMLLIFLGLAKQLSPDIDVSIGNDSEETSAEGFYRGNVDSRLADIQNEDRNAVEIPSDEDDNMFDDELEEKVVINLDKKDSASQEMTQPEEEPVRKPETAPVQKAPEEVRHTSAPTPTSTAPKTTAKVVVGHYATAEQAEVAKGILQEAGMGISPMVRNIGGSYTIQAGAFSTREAAQAAAQNLLKNNFPARVIIEQ